MSKKFTEEQYQKIVEIGDDFEKNGGLGILDTLNSMSIADRLMVTVLASQFEFKPISGIIMAIANPLTREWAHDKFVEKEKKYRWSSKKTDSKGNHILLYKEIDGIINIVFTDYTGDLEYDQELTESEIREWGFNPDMFDREEVQ